LSRAKDSVGEPDGKVFAFVRTACLKQDRTSMLGPKQLKGARN